MRFLFPILLAVAPVADSAPPPGNTHCLAPTQAQAAVQSNHLLAPGKAASAARRVAPGELLAARLCETGSGYVYMLHVLGQNGHVRRVVVDAKSAEIVGHN